MDVLEGNNLRQFKFEKFENYGYFRINTSKCVILAYIHIQYWNPTLQLFHMTVQMTVSAIFQVTLSLLPYVTYCGV